MEELVFDDLAPQQVPVKLAGKNYVLKEASADSGARYNSAFVRAIRAADRPSAAEGLGDLGPLLVSMCLFAVGEKGLHPVPLATIRGWRYGVQKALFERAKELSGLDRELDPLRDAFAAALSRDDSPVTLEAFRDFVAGLEEERFKPLAVLVTPGEEGLGKNSRNGRAATSGSPTS